MKVVLRQDVPKVGRRGEVKEVADGFGRNFLIAQGKAVVATDAEVKRVELQKEKKETVTKEHEDALRTCAALASATPLTLSGAANEEGVLFAAVSLKDILAALNERCKSSFVEKDLHVEEAIKTVGSHKASLGGHAISIEVTAA